MISQSDTTIIIPHLGKTENQRRSITECLKSLNETVPGMDKIVVMNGIDPEREDSWDNLSQEDMRLILLQDQGQCKAVNAAVATTNTKWIFVTNDDMIYAPGWWEILSSTYYDIGCVSPKLIEPRPGAPTFETYFCGGAGGDFDKQKWLLFADNYMKADVNRPLRTGFNLPFLIRRDVWDTVGGYDINYDPWGSNSDSDLQAKIHLAGIQPMQNPGVPVYHFGETSGANRPDRHSYWQANWDYFIKKWGFERQSSPFVWHSEKIINEEKLIFKPIWMGKYGKVIY